MKNNKTSGMKYAIECAVNNMRLGISRSYFIDWAVACGYSKNTAAKYWQMAASQYLKEVDQHYQH